MATQFDFPNLAPYQQAVTQQLLEQSRKNPIEEMIKAYQQGQALRQAPQIARQKAIADELSLEIQRANLQRLQRPEMHNVAGVGVVQVDPNNPAGYSVVAPAVLRPTSTAPKLGRIIVDRPTGRIFEITATGMKERTLDEAGGQVPVLQEDISSEEVLTVGSPASAPLTPKVAGLKTKNFVETDGSTHTYSIDAEGNKIKDLGMARSAPVLTPKKSGSEKAPPAKIQDQYIGSQNLFQTGPRLEQKIAELRAAGIKEPNAVEKAIINVAYQDPKGLFSGLTTAVATGQIRPEIADLEQLRAEIESNYTTAKAGLSQTASEIKRTIPVAPTRFDSWDRMISKTKNLREIAAINVANINKQYPGFARAQPSAEQVVDYPSEADVPEDLPSGTPITINGRPAVWE